MLKRNKWSKVICLALGIISIGLLVNAGRLVAKLKANQLLSDTVFVPYTVVLDETVEGSAGKTKGLTVTIATRSDGSQVLRAESFGSSWSRILRYIDFATGEHARIDEIEEMKTTFADSRRPTPMRDPLSSCLNGLDGKPFGTGEVLIGQDVSNGYRVAKIGDNWAVRLYAVDYGCAMIGSRVDFGNGNISDKKLVSLTPGEPQSLLFQVPDSYREVPYSTLFASNMSAERLRRFDEYYYSHRPK